VSSPIRKNRERLFLTSCCLLPLCHVDSSFKLHESLLLFKPAIIFFFLKLASRFGLALEILQYSLNIFIDLDWFPKQDLQSFSFSRSAHPSPVTFCLNYGPYSAFAWRQFAPKTIDGDSRLVLDWSRSVWFQPTFYVRASYWRRMGSNERSWHLCRTMVFCSLDTLTLFVLEALASLRSCDQVFPIFFVIVGSI
jgi:hypothetical protein